MVQAGAEALLAWILPGGSQSFCKIKIKISICWNMPPAFFARCGLGEIIESRPIALGESGKKR